MVDGQQQSTTRMPCHKRGPNYIGGPGLAGNDQRRSSINHHITIRVRRSPNDVGVVRAQGSFISFQNYMYHMFILLRQTTDMTIHHHNMCGCYVMHKMGSNDSQRSRYVPFFLFFFSFSKLIYIYISKAAAHIPHPHVLLFGNAILPSTTTYLTVSRMTTIGT
jgi:hypothetical protein